MVWLKLLLKLLGYAIGSVVMYWGLLFLLITPWIVGLLLVMLSNAAWNRLTGKTDEWQWFGNWTEAVLQKLNRLEFQWIGWIPGIVIQIWYAGYAANLVQTAQTSVLDKTIIEVGDGIEMGDMGNTIVLESLGILGIITAAVIFYGLYRLVVEVKLSPWIYPLVGGVALVAYCGFLQEPQMAQVLSDRWQQFFAAFLSAMIQS